MSQVSLGASSSHFSAESLGAPGAAGTRVDMHKNTSGQGGGHIYRTLVTDRDAVPWYDFHSPVNSSVPQGSIQPCSQNGSLIAGAATAAIIGPTCPHSFLGSSSRPIARLSLVEDSTRRDAICHIRRYDGVISRVYTERMVQYHQAIAVENPCHSRQTI
jgi:hypothetical protein